MQMSNTQFLGTTTIRRTVLGTVCYSSRSVVHHRVTPKGTMLYRKGDIEEILNAFQQRFIKIRNVWTGLDMEPPYRRSLRDRVTVVQSIGKYLHLRIRVTSGRVGASEGQDQQTTRHHGTPILGRSDCILWVLLNLLTETGTSPSLPQIIPRLRNLSWSDHNFLYLILLT